MLPAAGLFQCRAELVFPIKIIIELCLKLWQSWFFSALLPRARFKGGLSNGAQSRHPDALVFPEHLHNISSAVYLLLRMLRPVLNRRKGNPSAARLLAL
jgi:hypothetical protein